MTRLFAITLFLLIPAISQESLTLRQAVDRALANHPEIAAAASRIQSQEGLRLQAGKTYNPIFNFQIENVRAWQEPSYRLSQDSDIFMFLQQQWELFGKRRRRTEEADVRVRIAELEREQARRHVALRVKTAYWNAYAAERRVRLLEENQQQFARVVEYHEARVKEGAMAEADLIRVRLEGQRLAMEQNDAQLAAERARLHLQLTMGEEQFPRLELTETLGRSLREPAFPVDVSVALEQRIEVQIRRAHIEETQASSRVQAANAKPDLTWVAGYKRSGPFDALVLGAQMPVPFLNRNEGNIASAQAEERLAASLLRASEQAVRAEAEAALANFRLRRQQLEHTLPLLQQQANQTAEIADAAYQEGGSDLLRLLDAQRLRIEAETMYMQARTEYEVSIVELEAALGVPQ